MPNSIKLILDGLGKLPTLIPTRIEQVPLKFNYFLGNLSKFFPLVVSDSRNLKIDLISIHIPKTGGTSFENTLKTVYGWRLFRINAKKHQSSIPKAPPYARIIHGHFRYKFISKAFDIPNWVPIITWIRDPAQRVISDYFELRERVRKLSKPTSENLKLIEKSRSSLMEFAKQEDYQEVMSKFLDGVRLEDLFFIGIQEHYSKDLAQLAQMMGWRRYEEFHFNSGKKYKPRVPEEFIQEIRTLNPRDMALYQEALRLGRKRQEKTVTNNLRPTGLE